MAEEWRPILGWEGEYEVSDQGRVRSVARVVDMVDGRRYTVAGRVRAPWTDRKGYVHVVLYRNDRGKRFTVHSLVARAFLGECPDGMEVCHGNGAAADNRLANLRYDTRSANMLDKREHGTACAGEQNARARLTEAEVRAIRRAYASGEMNQMELARRYKTPQTNISQIVHRHTWRHVA